MLKKFLFLLLFVFVTIPSFAEEIIGNPQGKITLTEFFDYQCPHCRSMANTIDGLIRKNPDLRVVYYVVPAFGDDSWFEAKAALASRYQGAYGKFHQFLMYQHNTPSSQDILSLARQFGLNVDQLRADMNKPGVTEELRKNLLLAREMKIAGVPTFLVGPTDATAKFRFDGEVPAEKLQEAISNS